MPDSANQVLARYFNLDAADQAAIEARVGAGFSLGDFIVGTDPLSPYATSLDGIDSSLLTVGEFVPHRSLINSHSSEATLLATQKMHLTYFTAKKTEIITGLETVSGGTAAGATPTLVRYGVYSIAANGAGSLIASTPNDTAVFASTFTAYLKNLSVAWSKVFGQRYALATLVVSAGAMPTLQVCGQPATTTMGNILALAPRLCAVLTAQADLPASFVDASLAVDRNRIGYRLVP